MIIKSRKIQHKNTKILSNENKVHFFITKISQNSHFMIQNQTG